MRVIRPSALCAQAPERHIDSCAKHSSLRRARSSARPLKATLFLFLAVLAGTLIQQSRRRELRGEPSGCSGGAARRGLSPRDHTRSRRNVPLRLGRLAAWRGGGVGRRTQHVRTQICAVRRWVGLLGPGFRVRAWVPRGCAVTREDRARIGRFVRERGSFPAGVAGPLQTSGRRRRAPRVNAWVFRGGVFVWAPECGAPLRRTPTHRLIALASSSNCHAAAIVALQGC